MCGCEMKEYKGFKYEYYWESDDEYFVGRVIQIRDSLNFHASNLEDLQTAFEEVIDGYIEVLQNKGLN